MHDFDLSKHLAEHPGRLGGALEFLVGLAHQGADFTITRDGEPQAVIVGWERWQSLLADLGEHARTGGQ